VTIAFMPPILEDLWQRALEAAGGAIQSLGGP
jgi:hypothetical protein